MTPSETTTILRQLHDWVRGGTTPLPPYGPPKTETWITPTPQLAVPSSALLRRLGKSWRPSHESIPDYLWLHVADSPEA